MFIQDVCLAADWSSQSTFAWFYNLEVLSFTSFVLSVQEKAAEQPWKALRASKHAPCAQVVSTMSYRPLRLPYTHPTIRFIQCKQQFYYFSLQELTVSHKHQTCYLLSHKSHLCTGVCVCIVTQRWRRWCCLTQRQRRSWFGPGLVACLVKEWAGALRVSLCPSANSAQTWNTDLHSGDII